VNLLLTLGISMVAGGLRKKTLKFNSLAARTQTNMLTLAAISLTLPAGYSLLGGPATISGVGDLSLEFSAVLLTLYSLSLVFTLRTHERFLAPARRDETDHGVLWSAPRAFTALALSAVFVGWMGEVLVGSIELASKSLGMTDLFVGLVVVAIAGNAAESTAAVRASLNNRMDLSVGIAVGSSLQVALFVAPVLVVLSQWIGPGPMDLVFTPVEIVAVVIAVAITGQIASDGDSNWFEGVQLVAVYIMLGVLFFYLPEGERARVSLNLFDPGQ
jgi:Ca2+:H+ antiporter